MNFLTAEQFEQDKVQHGSILKWWKVPTEIIYFIETVEQITTKSERVATVISLVDEDEKSLNSFPPTASRTIWKTSVWLVSGSSNLWVSGWAPETQVKAITTMRSCSAEAPLVYLSNWDRYYEFNSCCVLLMEFSSINFHMFMIFSCHSFPRLLHSIFQRPLITEFLMHLYLHFLVSAWLKIEGLATRALKCSCSQISGFLLNVLWGILHATNQHHFMENTLTLFDMGGRGAWCPPKMFLTTVLKHLGGGSWNLVTFNINIFSIKKLIFGSLGYLVLPWQQVSCQGVLKIFWSYRSICFLITKF